MSKGNDNLGIFNKECVLEGNNISEKETFQKACCKKEMEHIRLLSLGKVSIGMILKGMILKGLGYYFPMISLFPF